MKTKHLGEVKFAIYKTATSNKYYIEEVILRYKTTPMMTIETRTIKETINKKNSVVLFDTIEEAKLHIKEVQQKYIEFGVGEEVEQIENLNTPGDLIMGNTTVFRDNSRQINFSNGETYIENKIPVEVVTEEIE